MSAAPSRRRALVSVSLLVLGASLLTVLARPVLASGRVPPLAFVWMQLGMGTLCLGAVAWWRGHLRAPAGLSGRQWLCIAGMGICNFGLVRLLFFACLSRVPAATHAYLINFVGILTMLLSAVWLKERPTPWQLVAAAVALSGTQLFFWELPPSEARVGLLYGALGVVLLAVTNILARQLNLLPGPPVSSLFAGWAALLIGGTPLMLWGAWQIGVPPTMRAADLAVVCGHAVVGIALAVTVWVHALRTLRSFEASLLAGASLVYTTLLAIPLLDEVPASHQVWGMVLMVLGLFGVQLRR